ncbi:MAG: FecR family protein [Scytolyngbya sp. HA4215-MV1]|nr:FecR family protein [Scytolyngbya sp. HA4215-MV1]
MVLVLTGCLASCTSLSSSPTVSPSPTSSQNAAADAPAKITEIQQQPVLVRQLRAKQEVPATAGMALQVGEVIRTQGKARAQIDLKNGLAFRIGGDSVLTLQPSNQLNLQSGEMITWVQPGQKVPTEIVTPTAIAGIRGTTVFVKIPPKGSKEGTLFFAWEGTVSVHLPNQKEEIFLKTGEEVRIRPGERNLQKIRQRIYRLKPAEWKAKIRQDKLLHGFNHRLPTLDIIEKIAPGKSASKHPPVP